MNFNSTGNTSHCLQNIRLQDNYTGPAWSLHRATGTSSTTYNDTGASQYPPVYQIQNKLQLAAIGMRPEAI